MQEMGMWAIVVVLLFFALQGNLNMDFGLLGMLALAGWFIVGEAQHH